MATDITANLRWKVYSKVRARMETITRANGYQTQPVVTGDLRVVCTNKDLSYLMLSSGDETVMSARVRAAWTMGYEIVFWGWVPIANVDPERELDKLIQDVRTCLCTYLTTLITDLGNGGEIEFGTLRTDQGALTDKGWASFALPVTFIYQTGTSW